MIPKKALSRKSISNPHSISTYKKRLIKSKAIDLKDNYLIDDLENGYITILPIDETKLIK